MNKKYWYSGNYGIEIELTEEQAHAGHHQGQCYEDVIALLPELKTQLDKISPDKLRCELKEYGAWDSEQLKDHHENLTRIVWLACGDVTEQLFEEVKS